MSARHVLTTMFLFLIALAGNVAAYASEQVAVVIGVGAPDLERIAANELVSQFERLFDASIVLQDAIPEKHQNIVLVGGPTNNIATRTISGDDWPKLSEQGFILRSFDAGDQRGIIVAGDTPVATFWAVCELGHRFGIRYLLREDIYPNQQPLRLSDFDELMEPDFKLRSWKTLGDSVVSPESWSAAEQAKLLRQLAKMKFNHLVLSVRPWQPFVEYEFGGVQKQSATLWRGEQYPIPRDAPGRTAFAAANTFVNPDFSGTRSPHEMTTAGIKHVRGIISSAKQLGMSVGLELSPIEFPREFEPVIPGLVAVPGTNDLAVHPGPSLKNNADLKQLFAAQLRGYVETYPDIDTLHFTRCEAGPWAELATDTWQELSKQLGPEAPALSQQAPVAIEGNLGILSQSTIRHQSTVIDKNRGSGEGSLSVRYAMLAELDPTMYYLTRAAWSKDVSAHSAHDDLFTTITGDQAISDRLWLGFGHIESATALTAEQGSDFATLSSNMLLKHFRAEPAPDWWEQLTEHYTQAMVELYRSHGPADPRARPLLYYYAKRSEYVLEYLACVKALRAAATAKQGGDIDGVIEQLEVAIESLYNAIDTLGDVAQDPSDRGLIAALNAYAYRPLLAEHEKVLESE